MKIDGQEYPTFIVIISAIVWIIIYLVAGSGLIGITNWLIGSSLIPFNTITVIVSAFAVNILENIINSLFPRNKKIDNKDA